MTSLFINYVLLALGIFTVLAAMIAIFLDKLKGDDIYFNIDVKEQEIKKVIDDAEEILSELNFTSDVIVKEIEEKINKLNEIYKSTSSNISKLQVKPSSTEHQTIQQNPAVQQIQPSVEKTTVTAKFKTLTVMANNKNAQNAEKPKSKQQMILEMAEQGISVIDIAKKMNMGQGEVSLILSLKNEES